jgi:predicted acylesterase/phospholipase RssA
VPTPADADGCFVGIAISGGGSRSATFSAACIFELQRVGIMRHVDYISSVSGGSMTAGYYCVATDDEWNPANVQKRMTYSYASYLIWHTLLPWNMIALACTDYDRSDVLADAFRSELFTRDGEELHFGDLNPARPKLLINATDLQSGRRFVFCNESFDELNADLAAYPLSEAVSASSSVPVLLHHVTLRDYSTIFKQYRHLLDGGVADNLGIQTLVTTYEGQMESARQAGRPVPYPNGAIFIVLDAATGFDMDLSGRGDMGMIQGLITGAGLTSTALLNRASSATMAELIVMGSPADVSAGKLREHIATLHNTGYLEIKSVHGHPVRVVHIALTRVKDLTNLPFESFGHRVNSIATYFNISQDEAYDLYKAAELLVRQKFEMQLRKIEGDLGATAATTRPAAMTR